MIKAKKFSIEDSNIANLGTELEKNVKHAAAEKENAWKQAGLQVGIEIWRIEKFHVVPWPKEQYGKFYSGDCYIVLRTYKKTPDAEKFSYDVHFWIGLNSTQDEYGTAAYKTVELDDHLHSAAVQHREIQGSETELFLTYFPKIQFLEGGIGSGFHHVEVKDYNPRLLQLKGKKSIVIREVPLQHESLNSSDVFVLDHGLQLYQMHGKDSNHIERAKAAEFAAHIQNERPGAEVKIFDETDNDENSAKFWEYLGGKKAISANAAAQSAPQVAPKKLLKLTEKGTDIKAVELDLVSQDQLESKDVFILDNGSHIFIWVGKDASKEEKSRALGFATDYLVKYNRPKNLPISRIVEGHENDAFLQSFDK